MKVYSGSEIRNVAVVGHNDTGKTTLVSQLLFNTGATTRQGRIEDGTTTTDFDLIGIEVRRRRSVFDAPLTRRRAGVEQQLRNERGLARVIVSDHRDVADLGTRIDFHENDLRRDLTNRGKIII